MTKFYFLTGLGFPGAAHAIRVVFALALLAVVTIPALAPACSYSKYGFKAGNDSQADVDDLFRGVYEERKTWKSREWRQEAQVVEADATDVPGKLTYAWAVLMAGDTDKALGTYQDLLKTNPNNYEVLCSYATALHALKRYAPARETLKKAIALKPGFRNRAEEFHLEMINYEEKSQQNYQYAREHLFLDALTPLWKNRKGVEENLSTVDFPEGYTSEGMAELLRQFPQFGDGWLVLGMLLEHEENFSMAAKAYDRALENGTAHAGDLKRYMATFREFGRSMDPARVGGRRLVQVGIAVIAFLVLAWLLKFVSGIVADITNARAEKKNAERRERRKHKDPDAPL
jgi:tetratricopeptide (TPR) repeat protein